MKNKQENKNVSEPRAALKPYPEYVCRSCAVAAANYKANNVNAWYYEKCGVCGRNAFCKWPRAFGYPTFEGHEKP